SSTLGHRAQKLVCSGVRKLTLWAHDHALDETFPRYPDAGLKPGCSGSNLEALTELRKRVRNPAIKILIQRRHHGTAHVLLQGFVLFQCGGLRSAAYREDAVVDLRRCQGKLQGMFTERKLSRLNSRLGRKQYPSNLVTDGDLAPVVLGRAPACQYRRHYCCTNPPNAHFNSQKLRPPFTCRDTANLHLSAKNGRQ